MIEGCFELVVYLEWWTPKGNKNQNNKFKQPTRASLTITENAPTQKLTKKTTISSSSFCVAHKSMTTLENRLQLKT